MLGGENVEHDAGLLSKTADTLLAKLHDGYGKQSLEIAYNTPDFEMIRHLQNNVYSFSAAKNYHQLKDMTLALMDGDRIRSEGEFMSQVQSMNVKYNKTWLRTERNTALAGGQMASRWVGFEANKEFMPMLQYSTVGDGKVRNSHKALDGIKKPVDDQFWNTYYPPNGWNCRCDVIQMVGTDIIPTNDDTTPQIVAPMFQTNLAKQGLIFPKGHPYFDGVPKRELTKAMAYLPPENSYIRVKGPRDTKIDIHVLHGDHEVAKNLNVVDDLIALGYKDIKLLPEMHPKELGLKKQFYPKGYKPFDAAKNADAWIKSKSGKDMVCDFKTLLGERGFSHHISYAALQADYAVIKLTFTPRKLGVGNIKTIVEKNLTQHKSLKGVIVIGRDGKLLHEQYR